MEGVVALTAGDDGAHPGSRARVARLLARLAAALELTGEGATTVGTVGGRWLVDAVVDAAPRIPIRDLATLRAHHDGLSGEALADALAAATATGAVGAAGGTLAAFEYTAADPVLRPDAGRGGDGRRRRHRGQAGRRTARGLRRACPWVAGAARHGVPVGVGRTPWRRSAPGGDHAGGDHWRGPPAAPA